MKRSYFITASTLILSALILTYSQSRTQSTQTNQTAAIIPEFPIEKQVGTQQRINRYFQDAAMSKVKNCWNNVQGKGTVSFKYIYSKSGERWMFTGVEVDRSSLPSDQAKLALRCMSDSMRGTSFPVDLAESNVKKFVLNWTWPVPLPTNAAQLTTAMFAAKPSGGGSGGSGCDGHGTPAKCYACKKTPGPSFECVTVCVGKETCTITSLPGGQINCGGETACASGGPFGVVGASRIN